MTRLAVLADIHGNIPALDAVIRDIDSQAVDEVLVGGDLVGRGPQGSRVIERILQRGWSSVRGNHEDYLLTFRRGEVPDDWLEADQWSASRWMAAELTPADVETIAALPLALRSRALPQIRVVHASPSSNNDGIGPWTSETTLRRHFDAIPESVLVCGHTHRPLHHRFDDGQVVNVGSVGLPFNGDRRAQYAIFDDRSGAIEVEFRQLPYDLDAIRRAYVSSGFAAEGGVTARLLLLELEYAQPFLVPFLQWSAALELTPSEDRIASFLDFYDPAESMRAFFSRLDALSTRTGVARGKHG